MLAASSFKMLFLKLSLSALFIDLILGGHARGKGTVILVSFDAFRWDYLDMNRTNTNYFNAVIANGVRAKYVYNVFPTMTFPNHYTLVTGQYPESHGIISNDMFDPTLNDSFSMSTNHTRWWNTFAEPIWITNQKQGHKSGLCYWPGYDVEYHGITPSFTTSGYAYDKPFVSQGNIMPWRMRVDLVVKWLKEEDPPSFIAMYFDSPDEAGHCCGPDSVNVTDEIRKCNNITGYLLEQLKRERLLDNVNLIITADHGTAAYNYSTVINFAEILSPEDKVWTEGYAYFLLHPSNVTKTYDKLKELEKKKSHFTVYLKENLPENLHFKHSSRIPEIVVIMEDHWVANTMNLPVPETLDTKGTHGWPPSVASMRPFFIAQGPAFKGGYKTGPIQMIDIYPLICYLLGIQPELNNGSLDRISHLLESPPSLSNEYQLTTGEIVALVIGLSIGITVCMYAVIMTSRSRHNLRNPDRAGEVDVPLIDGELYGDREDDNVL